MIISITTRFSNAKRNSSSVIFFKPRYSLDGINNSSKAEGITNNENNRIVPKRMNGTKRN
jgi:hypothetical protein